MKDINRRAGTLVAEARARAGISQRELATRARTSQATVARIEGGRTSPTLSTLERLVSAAGLQLRVDLAEPNPPDATIAAYMRDIDRTLLRENLKRTPEQRLRGLTALARFASEARRAGRSTGRVSRGRR